MTNDNLTAEMQTLLEIISATRSIHKLNILNQYKQLISFSGSEFNRENLESMLNKLTTENYISYIQDIDSYKITDKGKELVI